MSQTSVKTLLILGASGDLTGRFLLPGLARLVAKGRATGLQLAGAGSDPWSPGEWLDRVESSFADSAAQADEAGKKELTRILESTGYHQLDVTAGGQLAALLDQLEGPVAVYFALPPHVSQKACEVLTPADVPAGTRLVMENPSVPARKPLGSSTGLW